MGMQTGISIVNGLYRLHVSLAYSLRARKLWLRPVCPATLPISAYLALVGRGGQQL
jgi:hypothetical protein